MKFGLRVPSLKKRIAARTSWKRVVRHSMGLKMPRGYGFITNPKKALYNKVYRKTTFGFGDLSKSRSSKTSISKLSTPISNSDPFTLNPRSFVQFINTPAKFGKDGWIIALIIFSIFCLGNPIVGIPLLAGSIYWFYKTTKQSWYIVKTNLKKAKKLLKAERFNDAVEPLYKALEINKDDPELNYLLGVALHVSGNNEESLKHLQLYVNSNQSDLDGKLVLAYVLYKLGKFKEAASLLQQFPSDHPSYLLVIMMLGDSFLNLKEYDMAIDVFKRGPLRKTNLDSYLLQLHFLLGKAYKEKGDKPNALRELKRVYSFDMNYKDVSKEIELLKFNKNNRITKNNGETVQETS